ncbi:MAG: Bax inhibitor-1 family protein [Gammaproteobacteria bacterium]|nr:Bax inhibitor-1 family protein [Gammaproteobacteria bacterium]
MQFNPRTLSQNQEILINRSSMLRNTYLLLSLTLLFSAAAAGFAVTKQVSFGSSIVAFILSFVLLFATSALRNSAWGIVTVFAFTGCMGFSLGPMLNQFIHGYSNGGQLIMTALGGTGITFLASSAYIVTTKKDLSHWGKFLMIGLVVCIVAGLANLFFKMPAMQLTISTLLTFISAMLMMYDTSRIVNNGETNYIMATISLYLDIQMLFQNLLMLLGAFNGRD